MTSKRIHFNKRCIQPTESRMMHSMKQVHAHRGKESLCPHGVIRKGFKKAVERTFGDWDADDSGS